MRHLGRGAAAPRSTPTVPAALSASDDLIVSVLLPAGGLYRVYGVEVDYA